jgi:membrane protease YdiL (CAAX protease family)
MRAHDWHRDPIFWTTLALGVALVALLRAVSVAGQPPQLSTLLLLVVAYPVLEEFVFRGLLQPALYHRTGARRYGPLTLANVLTSVLFALAHLPAHGMPHAALVFLPSLAFGLFRDRHGTVVSPIVLHASWNAASLLLLGHAVRPF